MRDEGGRVPAVVKLDPTRPLKAMDRTITAGKQKGTTSLAVYVLEGNTLTICHDGENSDRRRPKEISSKGTQVVTVFKRGAP